MPDNRVRRSGLSTVLAQDQIYSCIQSPGDHVEVVQNVGSIPRCRRSGLDSVVAWRMFLAALEHDGKQDYDITATTVQEECRQPGDEAAETCTKKRRSGLDSVVVLDQVRSAVLRSTHRQGNGRIAAAVQEENGRSVDEVPESCTRSRRSGLYSVVAFERVRSAVLGSGRRQADDITARAVEEESKQPENRASQAQAGSRSRRSGYSSVCAEKFLFGLFQSSASVRRHDSAENGFGPSNRVRKSGLDSILAVKLMFQRYFEPQ